MMNDEVRRLLLEADLDELDGRGDSEIARLVREDPVVRALAEHLRESMQLADTGLMTLGALASTRARAGQPARIRRRVVLATALAMATVAAVMVVPPALKRGPRAAPAPAIFDSEPMTARLAASSTRPLAVFATDNPDIAIVWLLAEEEK